MMTSKSGKSGSAKNIPAWVEQALSGKKKITGFGHRVYKVKDPRATVLQELAEHVFVETGRQCIGFDVASLEDILSKAPCEVPNQRPDSVEPKDMKDKIEVKVDASPTSTAPGGSTYPPLVPILDAAAFRHLLLDLGLMRCLPVGTLFSGNGLFL